MNKVTITVEVNDVEVSRDYAISDDDLFATADDEKWGRIVTDMFNTLSKVKTELF